MRINAYLLFCLLLVVIRAKQFSVGSVFSDINFPGTNDLINFTNSTSSGSTAASIVIPGTLLQERAIGSKF